jgi:hypothetical protein
VARVLSTAFLVALLAATAVAFALTQGAKVELSPIYKTHVDPVFSPGNAKLPHGNIEFRLRKKDHLTVWMTRDGKRVATIVGGQTYPAGPVKLVFTGVSPAGVTLPDGVYLPVVRLGRSHRTIAIPSEMRIDTKPPVIDFPHRQRAVISPDGDGHKDVYRVRYSVNEPAQGILLVDGKPFEITRTKKLSDELTWHGRLDGVPARPGNHVLSISARDVAGNRTEPFPFAIVQIRYVTLGRKEILVRPGRRFAVRMSHDSPTVSWLLNRRRGTASGVTLHLRAPKKPGVYRLFVTVPNTDRSAKALVIVA